MPPTKPYKPIPVEHARALDAEAKRMGKQWYGPLDDEDEPDTYDLIMNAPDPMDYESCDVPCGDKTCPCYYKPKDEDA